MNYAIAINSINSMLYRYTDENDNGELYIDPSGWNPSIPPSVHFCIQTSPEKWKQITEFEAIEQFPEAFQDNDSSVAQ